MEPIELPIDGVLDLHTFHPKDVPDLLTDYFTECVRRNIFSVRIIHGKGKGILKKKVRGCLKRSDLVISFREAPGDAGGWGATLVELRCPG
ncbi:hypothetical protein D3OALGA1CA_5172 [Olavius algarvensis associated proteobacterium Delta 3]|nr:hypothetical protein D3OALGB2SA_2718 [Olavius algarvensis associated proteobacterium Delta 3]CAB5162946.1 hypothetical protein D3OALGA1CA_5172 [Olavius algarvensis associated proteobacterium Delta 3]